MQDSLPTPNHIITLSTTLLIKLGDYKIKLGDYNNSHDYCGQLEQNGKHSTTFFRFEACAQVLSKPSAVTRPYPSGKAAATPLSRWTQNPLVETSIPSPFESINKAQNA